ncbi:hypothetical protein [Listeria ivanovii]|nr:hypothetical protein [Listeria ivanovii]
MHARGAGAHGKFVTKRA